MIDFIGGENVMYNTRVYENISEIDFEDAESKNTISIESFCMQVVKAVMGIKHFSNDILIGAIDRVSQGYQVKCDESYKEVFNFVSVKLRELGW